MSTLNIYGVAAGLASLQPTAKNAALAGLAAIEASQNQTSTARAWQWADVVLEWAWKAGIDNAAELLSGEGRPELSKLRGELKAIAGH